MFPLQILREQPLIKFNQQLPMFNWHYPFNSEKDLNEDRLAPYLCPQKTTVRRRAVYIHIPFCETICNFCPFRHDLHRSDATIQRYLSALLDEIALKREFLGDVKVDAIFVGGGTPSLLSPQQIESLGETILRSFDLHGLQEFTFEVEVKSVSRDKLQAMHDIGVNRISFGAQTFSEKYRALFSLDATRSQITAAAEVLNSMFPYTNVDLLYGMAGQKLDELDDDVTAAMSLGTTTIDVYPINNLTAPRSMHSALTGAGLNALPEALRVQFRMHLERRFRELGYRPINGYGFSIAGDKCHDSADPVQHSPKFLYHDLVYGYEDDEIIGYGVSAISQMPGFNLYNFVSRQAYMSEVLTKRALPHQVFGPIAAPERGIVSFPFRGVLDKSRVAWERVPDETWFALEDALEAGLIADLEDRYVLTQVGWLFYVNLMYYFMPEVGKRRISNKIECERVSHACGDTDLTQLTRSSVTLLGGRRSF
jgi:coproporphyrinogen III oxidase-like Fe-S oxidoreductase